MNPENDACAPRQVLHLSEKVERKSGRQIDEEYVGPIPLNLVANIVGARAIKDKITLASGEDRGQALGQNRFITANKEGWHRLDLCRACGGVRPACLAGAAPAIRGAEFSPAFAASEFSFVRKKDYYSLKSGRLPDIQAF
jgi:hypothetical protein